MHLAPRLRRAFGIPVLFACAMLLATLFAVSPRPARAAPAAPLPPAHVLQVVAAENFYGALVQQLGGARVAVTSVLSNASQDPHGFEASPKVARALARADLVVYNGAAYDPWMAPLLRASTPAGRTEIVAATLLGTPAGANPHLWYEPRTLPALARAVSAYLSARDPAQAAVYQQRLADFLASLQPVEARIAALRAKYHGTKVSATEPVFGYMAEAIGLDMQNARFQMAVMNEVEPSATEVGAFEQGLKSKEIKVLIYNAQTSGQMSRRLLQIARAAGVPVVPVTETQPAGKTYRQWMLDQLDQLEQALAHPPA